ncbi:DHA2 family efflux MFS transporter permease subunit [Nocardia sp. NPDC101769]|uniref:DHA2 family efflux MFS transporter permease subunit n=1 Tax=Nocardia sp. NPDC101769 TaxID=3364333 RepID=UPI0037FB8777
MSVLDEGTTRGAFAPPQVAPSARWWTLGVVTLATSMLMIDLTAVNVAVPELRADFGITNLADLQWVLDAYALTLGVFLLTAGSLADKFGRKYMFLGGFAMFSMASLACGLSGNGQALDLSRGVQGIGAAALFAIGPALIAQEFTGADRAKALGMFAGGYGMAIAGGPVVGGALTQWLDWRWIFLVNVPLGMLAIVIGWLRIPDRGDRSPHPIDLLGLVTFSIAMTMLVFAILRGNAEGWTSGLILGLFVGAALLLAVFVAVERARGAKAMLDLSLFKIVSVDSLAVVTTLLMGAALAAIFLVMWFVQAELGYTPIQTGVRMLPISAVMMVMGGVAGALTVKVSPRWLLTVAGLATGLSLLSVPLMLRAGSGWTALLPCFFLIGVGLGVFNPTRAAQAINLVAPERAGLSNGVSETFQQVGVALGIAVAGAIFESRVATHFADSEVGKRIGGPAHDLGETVAATGSPLLGPPAGPGKAAVQAAHAAVVTGVQEVFAGGAVIVAVATVIALLFTRKSDLHESALVPAETN